MKLNINSLKLKNEENGYPWAEDELSINLQDEIQKKNN